jgi:hypothetical protein
MGAHRKCMVVELSIMIQRRTGVTSGNVKDGEIRSRLGPLHHRPRGLCFLASGGSHG